MDGSYLINKISIFCFPDDALSDSLRSYTDGGGFDPILRYSLGFNIYTKIILWDDFWRFKLILINISTDPWFSQQLPSFIEGSAAVIFAFSKTDPTFVWAAVDLYYNLRRMEQYFPPFLPVVFIGIEGDPEEVSAAECRSLVQELGVDYREMAPSNLSTFDSVLQSLLQRAYKEVLNK